MDALNTALRAVSIGAVMTMMGGCCLAGLRSSDGDATPLPASSSAPATSLAATPTAESTEVNRDEVDDADLQSRCRALKADLPSIECRASRITDHAVGTIVLTRAGWDRLGRVNGGREAFARIALKSFEAHWHDWHGWKGEERQSHVVGITVGGSHETLAAVGADGKYSER